MSEQADGYAALAAAQERALARLADGSYGICQVCGARISGERLAARPTARTCVGCVRPR